MFAENAVGQLPIKSYCVSRLSWHRSWLMSMEANESRCRPVLQRVFLARDFVRADECRGGSG